MFDRKKLKELLESEVKSAGSVRAAAARMRINPTSIQNYLDMVTEPRSRAIEQFAAYFRKPISYFIDDKKTGATASVAQIQQNANSDLLDKASVVLESGTIYADALKQNIRAFYQAVNEQKRAAKQSVAPASVGIAGGKGAPQDPTAAG
jgi:hypothetical protein